MYLIDNYSILNQSYKWKELKHVNILMHLKKSQRANSLKNQREQVVLNRKWKIREKQNLFKMNVQSNILQESVKTITLIHIEEVENSKWRILFFYTITSRYEITRTVFASKSP